MSTRSILATVTGGGSNQNGTYHTYLGRWLALVRIQSLPVTMIPLCVGYLTMSETVITGDIWPLLAAGVVAHFGFYAMNDLMDYYEDRLNKDCDKPLVSGDISLQDARRVVVSLIIGSGVMAYISFPEYAFYTFIGAFAVSIVYNYRSKMDWFSGVYLCIWGYLIVLTGSLYAGGISTTTHLFGMAMGLQMVMITIFGDVKDYRANEPSIPKKLNCYISKWGVFRKTLSLGAVVRVILLTINTSLVVAAVSEGAGSYIITAMVCLSTISFAYSENVMGELPYCEDRVKRDIVKYTVASASVIVISAVPISSVLDITAILFVSVAWGLLWQKVQYGSFFYFP